MIYLIYKGNIIKYLQYIETMQKKAEKVYAKEKYENSYKLTEKPNKKIDII